MRPVEIDHTNYPKRLRSKSDEELRFIIDDARAAIRAMPDGDKVGYYSDEINYCAMELKRRADRPVKTVVPKRAACARAWAEAAYAARRFF